MTFFGNAPDEPYITVRNGLYLRAFASGTIMITRAWDSYADKSGTDSLGRASYWGRVALQAVSVATGALIAFAVFELLRHLIAFQHILLSDVYLDGDNNTVGTCLQGADCFHMKNDETVYEKLHLDVGRASLPLFDHHGAFIGLVGGEPDPDAGAPTQRRHNG